jgi:hypothetical protein
MKSTIIAALALAGWIVGCSSNNEEPARQVQPSETRNALPSAIGQQSLNISTPTYIPDLQDGKLEFKNVTWLRELITPSGEQFGYFSDNLLEFDEEESFMVFGSERSRIQHSGDALKVADPITVMLATNDPLDYVKNIKTVVPPSGTIVWIEPSKDGSGIILSTDINRPTKEALQILGINKSQLPDFKLEFHIEPGRGVIFLLGDGTQYWGATEGPIKLGGISLRNAKGVQIVKGYPIQTR